MDDKTETLTPDYDTKLVAKIKDGLWKVKFTMSPANPLSLKQLRLLERHIATQYKLAVKDLRKATRAGQRVKAKTLQTV